MKFSNSLVGALALSAIEVAAFPTAMYEQMARGAANGISLEEAEVAIKQMKKRALGVAPGFNAAAQYVSNQGAHAFVAPKNVNTKTGDQRGPCPGLNAMANHGYLPHNGIATIQDFITGTYDVFGMGLDLGAFLAIYGAVIDGNLASWSIGGPSSQLGGLGSGGLLLSQPQGISGSHNKYESDASPTRPDLYEYGNDYKVIVSQFEELFNTQPDAATANYDIQVLTDFRYSRFEESIANNPHFFNGPFTGVVVQPAAYTFIYRFMGNKSAEHPEGILNQDVLKSFFSITGKPGSFVWTEGHEKIPDNWYKRAIGDEYTITYFQIDLLYMALRYPEFLSVGGNTGKTNSFTGINIQDLTGGVFNTATLAQGNNAICFALQFAQQAAPDLLLGVLSSVAGALSQLGAAFSAAESVLGGCPQLTSIDKSQFSAYPGAAGSY